MIEGKNLSKTAGCWIATIAVFFFLFSHPVAYSDEALSKADVDALIEPLIETRELVGLVVGAIYKDERYIFSYGSLTSQASKAPDGKTVFEIGSITKPITGLLLAKLVDEGRVNLDDPISKFLPPDTQLPRFRDGDIGLIDVATHTSGLPSLPTNLVPKDPLNRYADYSSDQLLDYLESESKKDGIRAFARRLKGESEPPYTYSNLGVGLLGYTLENACEEPYEKLIVDKVCSPLNLIDTRISLSEDQQARSAIGHNAMGQPVPAWEFDCLAGAAALRSTCDDMLDFLSVLIEPAGSELEKAIALSLEPRRRINPETSIGLCWEIVDKYDIMAHAGQTGGFQSMIWFRPKSKFGVIVMANTRNIVVEQIPPKIFQIAVGATVDPIQIRQAVRLDPSLLQSYVGQYQQNRFNTAEVKLVDNILVVRPSNSDDYPIFPKSKSEFFDKSSQSGSITFLTNDDGAVKGMVRRDGNSVLRYARVATP